jgi:hypothetical protein
VISRLLLFPNQLGFGESRFHLESSVYLHFGEEGKSWFNDTLLVANVAISDVMLFAVIFQRSQKARSQAFQEEHSLQPTATSQ